MGLIFIYVRMSTVVTVQKSRKKSILSKFQITVIHVTKRFLIPQKLKLLPAYLALFTAAN